MSFGVDRTGARLVALSPIRSSEERNATGAGTAVFVGGRTTYALQVTGVGGAASAWDVRLEGSLDGSAWQTILTHVTVSGDGALVFGGANRFPIDQARINVSALTLGGPPPTAIRVTWEASA